MRIAVTQRELWGYVEVLKPRESSLITFIGAVAASIAAGSSLAKRSGKYIY